MRWVLLQLLALSAGCQVAASRPSAQPAVAVPLPAVIAGANLRAIGDARRGYGTRTGRQTLERLKKLGVNTVAVLMEGRLDSREDTNIRPPGTTELEQIRAALLDANALGFATVLVPHLYLEDGDWRGYITLDDPTRRDAWWGSYTRFIDLAAGVSSTSGTSLLSIGVELKGLSKSPDTHARMRTLAERVRHGYSGVLTYSANWDEAEDVSFWDVVDLAGVNGYYPLVPDPERGAEAIARRLTRLSERAGREVVVLEAGYRSSPLSYVEPWVWPSDVPSVVDEAVQARAWAAVLAHWLRAPGVRGLLVWVISTDPGDPNAEPRHGFSPLGKPAEEVIARAFLALSADHAAEASPSAASEEAPRPTERGGS